jgi:transitional endoplasmic reticulum ATPase
MKEVYLKVTKSLPDDFGRGIARIDPPAFPELKLSQGDVIEIIGKRTTVAMAMGGETGSNERVRIDGFIRQNADVDIGEQVKVRKAQVHEAKYISFAPLEGTAIQFNDDIVEMIKKQLKNRPIIKGDAVPLMSGSNPFLESEQPNWAVTLIAVSVDPSGPVMISDDTEIDIRYKPVKFSKSEENIERYTGLQENAKRLRDIIDLHLKQPELFEHVGINPFRGILLYGAPGVGNKLFAEAALSGSNYPVFGMNCPDLISKYYGQSEEKLKGIFKDAVDHTPSIIMLESMDVLAPRMKRDMSVEAQKLLAQLISLIDDLDDGILVIGMVDNISDLDQALRASGRFEMDIEIKAPDEKSRLEILQSLTGDMPIDNVDLERIAKDTEGFIEADLETLVKKAALNALFRSVPFGSLDKPMPETMVNKIRVKADDFNVALEEAFKQRSEPNSEVSEHPKHSKGFDVDKQRYIESITEVPK